MTLEDASSVDASRKESNARRVPVEDGMEIDSSTGVAKGSHTSPNGEPPPRRLTIAGSNVALGQASDTSGDGNNSNLMAGGSRVPDANRGQLVILPPRARANRDRESLEDGETDTPMAEDNGSQKSSSPCQVSQPSLRQSSQQEDS